MCTALASTGEYWNGGQGPIPCLRWLCWAHAVLSSSWPGQGWNLCPSTGSCAGEGAATSRDVLHAGCWGVPEPLSISQPAAGPEQRSGVTLPASWHKAWSCLLAQIFTLLPQISEVALVLLLCECLIAGLGGVWYSVISNCRIQHHYGWKRPLGSSSPTVNPSPPCVLNHVMKSRVYMFFESLQGWWFRHLPGQPVPMSDHSFHKEIFPNIQSKPPLKFHFFCWKLEVE